MNIWTSTNIN